MSLLKSWQKDNQILEIHYDEYPQDSDPRNNDNLGIMVCSHKRYDLGDDQLSNPDLQAYFESCDIDPKDIALMLPLWLYDHSGISISCGDRIYPYNDQWDSGQIGYIYVTKQKVKKDLNWDNMSKKRLEKLREYLTNEVKEYDLFLRGEVFYYTLFETKECDMGENHKQVIDSCGGFIGIDHTINCLESDYNLKEWNEIDTQY